MAARICGIYVIKCTANDVYYVGQSVNIKGRLSDHKGKLRHGKHYNKRLQNTFTKYGEKAFKFVIAVRCAENSLDDYEQIVHDIFKRHKTMCNYGKFTSCVFRGVPNLGASKRLTELNKDAEFQQKRYEALRIYRSSEEFADTMRTKNKNKYFDAKRREGHKQYSDKSVAERSARFKALRNSEEFKIVRRQIIRSKCRSVVYLPTMETYPSISDASESLGVGVSSITNHLHSSSIKFPRWYYVDIFENFSDVEKSTILSELNMQVKLGSCAKYIYEQYDSNNTFLKLWTANELLNSSEFNMGCVSRVCNGKNKTHKGFIWKKIPKIT